MIAILIFMVALLFFVIALEVDARRRPRVEQDSEEDDLMWELTQTGPAVDRRCACDPLEERELRRNVGGG